MNADFIGRSIKLTVYAWIGVALSSLAFPLHASAATRFASADGMPGNTGKSRGQPWNAQSCFELLRPGDTCVYLPGNYGRQKFAPAVSGSSGQKIIHQCETLHGCTFDQLVFRDVSHLEVKNIASDTRFYDATKSFSSPRMGLYNAHHLKFDSIFVRGEPQACAEGNPGSDCKSPSDFNRYNDLIRIGNPQQASETAWMIEITGSTELIDGNHSVIQMYDDRDSKYCEPNESDIWIHGTPEIPIKMSSKYHHIISFKGTCRVLIEYVDFGPAGTGRGDLTQPRNAADRQAGGILHGSTMQQVIVRYSNFSNGGSATKSNRNISHIEVGTFGNLVNGACFPHNSHYRPWGTFAAIGRLNETAYVRHVSILNNAVAEPWHMTQKKRSAASSPYQGFAISRSGKGDKFLADIDGIVVESGNNSTELFHGLGGKKRGFTASTTYLDGVQFGPSIWKTSQPVFRNAAQWDFRPEPSSKLAGSAAPIANTSSSGNGKNVSVTRPECFAGPMNGLRNGDTIDIGGAHCTIASVDIASGVLSCKETISWSKDAEIFYKIGGRLVSDIGSRLATDSGSIPSGSLANPKPPALVLEQ